MTYVGVDDGFLVFRHADRRLLRIRRDRALFPTKWEPIPAAEVEIVECSSRSFSRGRPVTWYLIRPISSV